MKLRKSIYIFIAAVVAVASFSLTDFFSDGFASVEAAAKKKPVKKSSNSKKKTSAKKKSTKKKSTSKKKTRRTTKKVTKPAEPKEVVLNDSLTLRVNESVLAWIPDNMNPGGLRVNSVKPDSRMKIAKVGLNENFTYLPVTRELIDSLSRHISLSLPDSISDYRVSLNVGTRGLAYYITKVDKLPERFRKNPPFVTEVSPVATAKKGMPDDILALWHSHGRYFRPGSGSWQWQRPLLFQSVEDTYTMSYILPYVVPMLENAGAYVMLPRERDTNRNEVIVDNDVNPDGQIFSQPYYKEMTGTTPWTTGELEGFIYDLPDFRDTENPFENGTYRQTTTVKGGKPSVAAWYADIPEDGEYAVYVSYKSLPNSTEDAHYTVNYSGGSKEFIVNQTMGGGTWIYLGTFPLEEGYSDKEPVVTLTNQSDKEAGLIVTADAVKIGGGMGNIARSNRRADIYYDPSTPDNTLASNDRNADDEETAAEGDEESDGDDEGDEETADDVTLDAEQPDTQKQQPAQPKGAAPTFRTSGMPRFLEGARYWLHWAGFPEYVYSPYHGSDDYKDDYTSRGHWVNYLAGGSRVLPGRQGLNIPVDLSFALHSDAGKKADDSFVGTLGIYYTNNGDTYVDGTPRINSRMLTDIVMRQITNDIRRQYEPRWVRRSMWDKSYVEARVPEVPTTLIELMSHQNFADMQYGLDPEFKFAVGRAIYKGLARFMAERKDRDLVIQPLPVNSFMIRKTKSNHYRLSWKPTPDPLEETAMPHKYVIMERTEGDLGFHKIAETSSAHYDLKVSDNRIHSFKVIAVNDGGASFPSEVLALRDVDGESKPALIINGFTRVSGPAHFSEGGKAGFDAEKDFGVPYIRDISFTGYQTEFNRNAGESFGRSRDNYTTQVIAGNTFDFPEVHGQALADSGIGFVSASLASVEEGEVKLQDYRFVDLILGKQKTTVTGNGTSGVRFRTFPAWLQEKLRGYVEKGGNLLVSGEYVVSDLFDTRSTPADREFAEEVLGVVPGEGDRQTSGRIRREDGKTADYSANLNSRIYIVENPDILVPADGARTERIMTFSDSGLGAGYRTKTGKGTVTVLSVPVEALTSEAERANVLREATK